MAIHFDVNVNRCERKREETHKKIIRIATELFRKQGFEATTLEQIAEEVDIARTTLYNHFPVKEAIVDAYAQDLIREHKTKMKHVWPELPDTRSRLTAVLFKQWEVAKSEFNMDMLRAFYVYRMQILFQSFKDRSLRSGFGDVLADIIRLGQETGEIKKDVSAKDAADLLDWIHANTVMHWIADPARFPIYERIKLSVDHFLDGIKSGG
jgi:AcrR family transcriptional regulator